MEKVEKLQESSVLAQLGLNDKTEWVLYDERIKKLFEYIADNLDAENILTSEELFQFESLVASGEYKEGDELTEELKALEQCFPGIFAVTDDSIEEMQREIEFLNKDTADRENRIRRMEETHRKQLKSIEKNQKKCVELAYQEKVLAEECVETSKVVENIQKSNQSRVVELKQSYIQPQNPPCLLFQMPLDQLTNKFEQFTGKLDLFMRENFNVTSFPKDADRDEASTEVIVDLKQRAIDIDLKKFDDELTLAGFNSITRSIEELKHRLGNGAQDIRLIIDTVEEENERLEFQLEVLRKESELLIEQRTEQKMAKIFNEHFKMVNKHALERLDAVKTAADLSENIALTGELFWAVMELDIDRLKNRVDNSEELASETHDCHKRLRTMKTLARHDPVVSLNELFLKKLQDMLTEVLPLERLDLPSLTACLHEYINYEEKTQRVMKSNVRQEHLTEIHEMMKQNELRKEQLRDFVFNGPTTRPKLYDSKLSMAIFNKEQKKIEIEKAYEEAKMSYKKKIIDPSHDRFVRMSRNLWIYFLTEPKKVLECIKEVQKKAAEKGSSGFKAMNITLNRPN